MFCLRDNSLYQLQLQTLYLLQKLAFLIICILTNWIFLALGSIYTITEKKSTISKKSLRKKKDVCMRARACVMCKKNIYRFKSYLLHGEEVNRKELYISNLIEIPRFNLSKSLGQTFPPQDVKKRSSPSDWTFNGIVAVAEHGRNEIDRSGGGKSFAAMRHLNWLNADKLQRYIPSARTPPSPRYSFPDPRAFFALFPDSVAVAAWKTRHLEVSCRIYVQDPPEGFYVSDATSRLQ